MSSEEIIGIVERVTGVSLDQMLNSRKTEVVCARHVLTLILFEEKWRKSKIARLLNRNRTAIGKALIVADELITTNKKFKADYLGCIRIITEIEDSCDTNLMKAS